MNTHDKIELPAEFVSSNSIPVERATITRERMTEILQDAIEADRKRNDNWRHAVMCAISHNDYETDAPRRVQQALRLLSDAFHGLPFRESIIDDLIADRQRRGEPVVLATYHAIVDESEKHIIHDTRTNQLEIYDEREDAVKAAPDHLSVVPVYVTATEGPLYTAPQPTLDAADLAFIADELRQAGKNRAADLVLTAMAYPTQPAEPDYKQLFEQMCERCDALDAKLAEYSEREPVAWQFYDDGRWWNGDDRIKDHRKNTESAGYKTRDLYTAPQPAEPVKVPSEDERVAQGLPPYKPRKPTEEEWARLTENGRKAWGGPVKAGRDGQATMLTELSKIERGIRSLIPKEPPCET